MQRRPGILYDFLARHVPADPPRRGGFFFFRRLDRPGLHEGSEVVLVNPNQLRPDFVGGQLPALDTQTLTLTPLIAAAAYTLVPENGLRAASCDEENHLPGAHWQALETALAADAPFTTTLHTIASLGAAIRPLHALLRQSLQHYCGAAMHTPRLVREAKALASPEQP